MNITAFIFARGGSKRIPNKNIKLFAGKPLIAWSIEFCLSIQGINRVIVSTDSKKIAKISKSYGAEVPFMRPKNLSKDNSNEWMAWKHALNYIKKNEKKLTEYMISIPTTSPLRKLNDIKKCLKEIQKKDTDVVLTTTKTNFNPFFNMVKLDNSGKANLVIKNYKKSKIRQNYQKIYGITTVAYVARTNFVLSHNSFFDTNKVKTVEVPVERSIDIDTLYDFKIAEQLMLERLNKKK